MARLEETLDDRFAEKLRDMETLLQALYNFSRSNDIRMRKMEADLSM